MATIPPLRERPETLTELVYKRIRDAIVNGSLPAGARVTEASVAAQLNVSKTPVREALVRLRELGLIESDCGRGARVVRSTPEALADAYEMREVLELVCVRLAAQRALPADIETLQRTARASLERAKADDEEGFNRESSAFHRALFRAPGNLRIEKAIRDAFALAQALHVRELPSATARLRLGRDHVRCAKAIATRDADEAVRAMERHSQTLHAYLITRPVGSTRAARQDA
jgi:DNA-binding GntR family transcriptional regulator